jgi:hypothetical protein
MIKTSLVHPELLCAVCGKAGSVAEIDTYKSIWRYCGRCGCYSREQKDNYPFQKFASVCLMLFKHIPKLNGFLYSLAKKKQGVDFYRYYSEQLASGERGPWAGQSDMVTQELQSEDLLRDWSGQKVLEISGEPGFFAQDLMKAGADIMVSGFADDVALAMRERLGVKAFTYDFNVDDIVCTIEETGNGGPFDYIFVRFAIGFCQDISDLMMKLSTLLKSGGLLYISFSPASRAILLRWMFDDYTYLRQYTETSLTKAAEMAGLQLRAHFDEGYFHWDHGPYSLHWSLRPFARRYYKSNTFFQEGGANDSVQQRVALAYGKP